MSLNQMQVYMIQDSPGRFRCPHCGRYRRIEDFPDQTTTETIRTQQATIRVTVAPGCRACWTKHGVTP